MARFLSQNTMRVLGAQRPLDPSKTVLLMAGFSFCFLLPSAFVAGFGLPLPRSTTSYPYAPQAASRSSTQQSSIYAVVDPHNLLAMSELPSISMAEAITAESWRQYVPLAVSSFVILDILLGSPFVNLLMKPLRDATEQQEASSSKGSSPRGGMKVPMVNSDDVLKSKRKERIDSDKVAQAAIDRARNTLELRSFLESRKSDWDRMEEMKKSLDKEMQNLDEELEAKQKAFDTRKEQ